MGSELCSQRLGYRIDEKRSSPTGMADAKIVYSGDVNLRVLHRWTKTEYASGYLCGRHIIK